MAPRRTFARAKHLAQAGFSLIELMVAITILTILGAAAFAIFGGATDSAKAVAFIDNSAAVKSSAQLFKTQTGCFPANGRVLFDKAEAATTTANFCGTNLTNVWTKPFLDARPVDANGNILLDTLGAGVVMSFSRAAGGIGQEYWVSYSNVPNELVIEAVSKCNGRPYTGATLPTTFADGECRGTVAAAVGTFDRKIGETL